MNCVLNGSNFLSPTLAFLVAYVDIQVNMSKGMWIGVENSEESWAATEGDFHIPQIYRILREQSMSVYDSCSKDHALLNFRKMR